jgi:hypothetical protein
MNIKKIYNVMVLAFLSVLFINMFSRAPIWESIESYAFGLFAVIVSIRVIQESKESNLEKQASSELIKQLSFICPPNLRKENSYRKIEMIGYAFGVLGIFIVGIELMKLLG